MVYDMINERRFMKDGDDNRKRAIHFQTLSGEEAGLKYSGMATRFRKQIQSPALFFQRGMPFFRESDMYFIVLDSANAVSLFL